jgi:hypothetical protein
MSFENVCKFVLIGICELGIIVLTLKVSLDIIPCIQKQLQLSQFLKSQMNLGFFDMTSFFRTMID